MNDRAVEKLISENRDHSAKLAAEQQAHERTRAAWLLVSDELDEVTAERDQAELGWRQTKVDLAATEATLEARNREVGRWKAIESAAREWFAAGITAGEIAHQEGLESQGQYDEARAFAEPIHDRITAAREALLAALTSPPSTTGAPE